jgi:SAM-dependent methyltransferase
MARTKFASGQCCAVELSSEMARICADKVYGRGNVAIEIGNFMTWESPPNVQFDLIFSMEVFYYFEDVCFAIKKAANLLAENGELIVMVDYYDESPDSEGWSNELGIKLSRWSKSRYFNAFEAAGLQAVAQEVKSGGVCEHGLTLCTRGIRRSAATPAGGNKPGYISS